VIGMRSLKAYKSFLKAIERDGMDHFPAAPYVLRDGVWDCMGENMVATHIRAHQAGVKIEDIHGYRNLDIGFDSHG